MAHKTYYVRAPDIPSIKADIQSALEAAGIDPFGSGVLEKDTLEDGTEVISFDTSTVAAFGPGEWPEQRAEYDSDGNETQARIDGDHAIVTARTDDPALQDLIEQFQTTGPNLDPSEVPDSNKQPNGTSRIAPPDTPIRPIATK
jgi:hypothetical protein